MSTQTVTARARDLGIPMNGVTGAFNAITDVPGVEVGYETLVEGDDVRTGVTMILPLGRNGVGTSCPAGWFSLNGNGELTGTAWLDETGALSLPIGITNTHAIGPVHRGIIDWAVETQPALADRWLLPVVGETWDGYLNDLNLPTVSTGTARQALENASAGLVAEGSVGGGTGMNCYDYKGGTGTASRLVEVGGRTYTVAVLTQANFGARHELVVSGRPLGPLLLDDNPFDEHWNTPPGAGSCITVVATDAPLLPNQCKALAKRVPLGLARTGTSGSHFSGDLFLAFSATNPGALDSLVHPVGDTVHALEFLQWGATDPLYTAVVECVEESVLNVLVAGETMIGRQGRRSPAFPLHRLRELLHN